MLRLNRCKPNCRLDSKSVCCPVYLQVVLGRRGAVRLLALPFGFSHGVPASDLVLISDSGGRSHAGRESCSGWEALWRRSVCSGESQVSERFASRCVKALRRVDGILPLGGSPAEAACSDFSAEYSATPTPVPCSSLLGSPAGT